MGPWHAPLRRPLYSKPRPKVPAQLEIHHLLDMCEECLAYVRFRLRWVITGRGFHAVFQLNMRHSRHCQADGKCYCMFLSAYHHIESPLTHCEDAWQEKRSRTVSAKSRWRKQLLVLRQVFLAGDKRMLSWSLRNDVLDSQEHSRTVPSFQYQAISQHVSASSSDAILGHKGSESLFPERETAAFVPTLVRSRGGRICFSSRHRDRRFRGL